MNFPLLQNQIKRDPESYRDEFLQQLTHFDSLVQVVSCKPQDASFSFSSLLTFLSHVVSCYADHSTSFGRRLLSLPATFGFSMHPELRQSIVKSLFLLCSKGTLPAIDCYPVFIELLALQNQSLRTEVRTFLQQDIRNRQRSGSTKQIRQLVTGYLCRHSDASADSSVVRSLLKICISLYRKGVWRDAALVNQVAECCFAKSTQVAVVALGFFVSFDQEEPDESSSDEDAGQRSAKLQSQYQEMIRASKISGKSGACQRRLKKAKARYKRSCNDEEKEPSGAKGGVANGFHAVELLRDASGFAEKLFSVLKKSGERLQIRLLMMSVLSCAISVHRLQLADFYTYLIRYLTPKQREVSRILAFAAQSCHETASPSDCQVLVRAIANSFVADHCACEVIVIGLNTIREICKRAPLAMDETLLSDLAQYRTSKDKGITMAARSLIALYREVAPQLLHRRERGRDASYRLRHGAASVPTFGSFEKAGSAALGLSLLQSAGGPEASECDELEEPSDSGESEEERPVDPTKEILTDADFKRIRTLQRKQSNEPESDDSLEEETPDQKELLGLVSRETVEQQHHKRKSTYEQRVASSKAGRADRPEFGSKRGKKEKHSSTTNKQKSKRKNFLMTIHKRSKPARRQRK